MPDEAHFRSNTLCIARKLNDVWREKTRPDGFEVVNTGSYSLKTIIKASSSPLALELAAKGVGLTSVVRCQLKYGRSEIVQSLVPISIGDCKLPVYMVYNRLANKSLPEINLLIKKAKEEYFDASGL